jgi:hypothetical protein
LIALAGVYLLCNLTASAVTAARNGWGLLRLLPLVFAAYHFGYGWGFLHGVVNFIILHRVPARNYSELSRTTAGINS